MSVPEQPDTVLIYNYTFNSYRVNTLVYTFFAVLCNLPISRAGGDLKKWVPNLTVFMHQKNKLCLKKYEIIGYFKKWRLSRQVIHRDKKE
jgi:hypothetical protein